MYLVDINGREHFTLVLYLVDVRDENGYFAQYDRSENGILTLIGGVVHDTVEIVGCFEFGLVHATSALELTILVRVVDEHVDVLVTV